MNTIFRLIWREATGEWQVASEHARSRGKRSSRATRRAAALLCGVLAAQPALAAPPIPSQLPTGGQVVAGQATISQSGAALTVNQGTAKAILNWQSFSIGSSASVNFVQPSASSVALNRVLGSDPSAIYGRLTANGQVFLVNPNGVLFGPGARVDVGGLVATTMNIRNDDFLAGQYRFFRDGGTGSVVNQGEIAANYVALLAPEVRNEGVVTARMGTVTLAAGEAVTLGITGNSLITVQVEKATVDTLVENRHLIRVDGGTAVLSAQSVNSLLGSVVNSGTVEANGVRADGGTIRLTASSAIAHSGSLSADAGANGRGGNVIAIADLANPASRTTVSGVISARGGAESGDGGFIETSATHLKIVDSARIDTSAPRGNAGTWLLDPYDFTIAAANGDITGAALGTALGLGNVTIATANTSASCTGATCGTGSSSGNGDIHVNDSVTWSSNRKLTLSAWRNVNINAPINVNGSGGSLALEFAQSADTLSFPAGGYFVNAPVNLAAGTGFSTKAATDGPTIAHTVIRDNTALGSIASNLAGSYVLGIDVAAPGSSWTPLGTVASPFMGSFDGLGHKVTGLVITGTGTEVGLFGAIGGLIQNVGVTGASVEGSRNVGALVGYNNGSVVNSYATGTVTGNGTTVGAIGGLVGRSLGPIFQSYANVAVSAPAGDQTSGSPLGTGLHGAGSTGGIGGLVGVLGGALNGGYAKGSVSGINAVGGLVGYSAGTIDSSYSTGAVSLASGTSANIGGLVGQVDQPASLTPFIFNSFWDTQTSGRPTSAAGSADASTGATTATMKTAATFTGAGWHTNPFTAWELRDGQYPLIKTLLQPIYVIADNKTATFNGSAVSSFTSTISPATTGGGNYTGTVAFTPSTSNPTNAGTYTVAPSGVSVTAPGDQHGYRIEFVSGKLTINAAPITTNITGNLQNSVFKTYDGSSTITGLTNANFFTAGWQSGDGATITKTTGTITDGLNASASTTRPVTVSLAPGDFTATNSTNFSNYVLPTSLSGNIGEIRKANLTLGGSRAYDGSTTVAGSILTATGVNSETFSVTGASAVTSKNASATPQALSSVASLVLGTSSNGGLAANYNALAPTGSAMTINKANLTLGGTRAYDGTTAVAGSLLTATGVNGETFAVTGTGASGNLASANASTTAQTLQNVSGLSLGAGSGTGVLAGNYNALSGTGSAMTINKANLTLGGSRAYDGSTTVAGSILTATGVNSETFTVTGAGDASNLASKDASVTPRTLASMTGLALGTSSNDGLAGNYNALATTGSAVTINQKALSVLGLTSPLPSYGSAIVLGTIFTSAVTPTGATLATAIAPGTGSAADGKPYSVDGPLTFTGTPTASNWTVTSVPTKAVSAPVTGLSLSGAGAGNYTLTGTSVSSTIKPVAFYIAFRSVPSSAVAGVAFGIQPSVMAFDGSGNVVTTFSGTVTLSGTGLVGTLTASFVGGVATFTGLSFRTKERESRVLTASSGLFATTSPTVVVHPDAASATTSQTQTQAQSKTFTLKLDLDASVVNDRAKIALFQKSLIADLKTATGCSACTFSVELTSQ